jgi:hypothetical protein
MIPRDLGFHFAIDTNRINARQCLPNMNRLERWKELGLIFILMPESAYVEALRGADARRLLKTCLMIYSVNTSEGPDELKLREKVEKIICPTGRPDVSTENDIDIVVNAHKYDCILITADGGSRSQPGGILGRQKELLELGIRVVSDAEAGRPSRASYSVARFGKHRFDLDKEERLPSTVRKQGSSTEDLA